MLARTRRAAIDAAEALGLNIEAAELLAFQSNVLLRLHPHDLVARVSGEAAEIRSIDTGRAREIAVTRFLADAGAPVAPPSDLVDPGPYVRDGLTVTFWNYIAEDEDAEDDGKKSGIEALETCSAAARH